MKNKEWIKTASDKDIATDLLYNLKEVSDLRIDELSASRIIRWLNSEHTEEAINYQIELEEWVAKIPPYESRKREFTK